MPQQIRKIEENKLLHRDFSFAREAIDEKARTVEVAFSSETEQVERWFGIEILDHDATSIRLGRLQNAAPLLMDHNTTDQIGVVVSVSIGADRVGRAVVRFGKSPRANEIFNDVVDGIRSKISVGYNTYERRETEEIIDGLYVHRVTDWEPAKISIVSIAADDDVGIGRSAEPVIKPIEPKTQPMDIVMNEEERKAADLKATRLAEAKTIETNEYRENVRAAEVKRIAEINFIGNARGAVDLAKEFVDSGKSLDAFRAAVLDKMDADQPEFLAPARHAGVDMNNAEHGQYSVVRAMHADLTGDYSKAGFEREVSDTISKQLGRNSQGIFVPTNLRTPLIAKTDASGGYAVETKVGTLIEMLRNKMMVRAMGATVLSGLTGDLSFPKQATGSAFSWVAENPGSDQTNSDATLGQVLLAPKQGQSSTAFSRNMLAQSSTDVEMFVRNDLTQAAAIGLDLAALHGTGSSNQPTGIINVSGIGLVSGGTNGLAPTWANMVALETEVAQDNADIGSVGYLTNAKVRGKMKTVEKASGTAQFLWNDGADGFGMVNGYRAGVSNQVASNLTKGTASSICSAAFFGNWADLLIGEWGAIEIIQDPYSKKKQGLVEVTSFVMADIAVRHAQSFAVNKDILTT